MTIKQQGGIFGRNPTFNDLTVEGTLTTSGSVSGGAGTFDSLTVDTNTLYVDATNNATLIGTTTWDTTYDPRFQVQGTAGDGTQGILVSSYKPSVTFFDFSGGTPAVHRIAADSGKLSFEIDTAQNGTFTEAFGVTSAGNIAMANGKGIDFSATSGTGTSELFDDYEEGAATITLTPNTSGSITLEAALNSLSYTKVGRLVTLTGYLEVASVSSPVGTYVTLAGLPFTSANSGGSLEYGNRSMAIMASNDTTSRYTGFLGDASTSMNFFFDASTVSGSSAFYLNFSYITA